MSVPKNKLHELIDLIPADKSDEIVIYLENFVKHDKSEEKTDPVSFFGTLKDWDIDVEKESKRMRNEWNHREWKPAI
jgi:hypothetical protein